MSLASGFLKYPIELALQVGNFVGHEVPEDIGVQSEILM